MVSHLTGSRLLCKKLSLLYLKLIILESNFNNSQKSNFNNGIRPRRLHIFYDIKKKVDICFYKYFSCLIKLVL